MSRTRPGHLVLLAAIALTGSAVACGSSGNSVVHHPGTSAAAPTTSPPPSTPAPSSPVHSSGSPTKTGGGPRITVTPHTGLLKVQTVRVRGTGFTAGQAYTIVECAQKGTATGPGDCNLPDMLTAVADRNGAVRAQLPVLKGPFGANKIVCSAQQACLVSVTQASLSPTEEADQVISFAP